MTGVRIAVLAALNVAGTVLVGWWMLPVLGVLRGLPPLPRRGAIVEAAAAGAMGWLVLLGWSALGGPVWRLAREVGPIFHLPPWALGILPVAFAGVAAGAAAAVTRQILRRG